MTSAGEQLQRGRKKTRRAWRPDSQGRSCEAEGAINSVDAGEDWVIPCLRTVPGWVCQLRLWVIPRVASAEG